MLTTLIIPPTEYTILAWLPILYTSGLVQSLQKKSTVFNEARSPCLVGKTWTIHPSYLVKLDGSR
jgi:hypothetical protein